MAWQKALGSGRVALQCVLTCTSFSPHPTVRCGRMHFRLQTSHRPLSGRKIRSFQMTCRFSIGLDRIMWYDQKQVSAAQARYVIAGAGRDAVGAPEIPLASCKVPSFNSVNFCSGERNLFE